MNIKPITFFPVLIVVLIALQASGCRDNFQPLQKNDKYAFSVFGSLDIHADTQWVRVMPVGKTLIPKNPTLSNAKVTLTRENTGEKVILNDSLFVFGNSARVWNYWTTMPLPPNEKYTLRVEGSEGKYSTTTVTVPSPLPLPVVNYDSNDRVGIVTISSDDPVVTVTAIVDILIDDVVTTVQFSILDELAAIQEEKYRARFDIDHYVFRELGVSPSDYAILRKRLLVVSASEDWSDLSGLSATERTLLGIVSNVENGTGIVAGIASHLVPIKRCFDEEGNLIACEEI